MIFNEPFAIIHIYNLEQNNWIRLIRDEVLEEGIYKISSLTDDKVEIVYAKRASPFTFEKILITTDLEFLVVKKQLIKNQIK